jgi:anaerobic magnesium-protoporphyrin IX monomethyl ester cyclase
MKVLLTVPKPIYRTRLDYPPSGVAYIAAYLLRHNKDIDVKIIDFGINDFFEQKYTKELQHFSPNIVGISISTLHYYNAIQIANFTREFNSEIPIIMGGPHATARPDDCLRCCDVVVRGEGELTFNELVQRKTLSSIEGISYKQDGQILHNPPRKRIKNLDELPFPAYNLLDIKKYFKYPMGSIMGSRGCPFNCTYCFSPIMWERKLTTRSPKNIADEIEFLHNQYGYSGIIFHDDTLNIPLERGINTCDELIERGLHKNMNFECQLRMNRQFVSSHLFKKMKEANFTRVMFGVESGSQKVLNLLRRSLTISEMKEAIKMSKNEGLKTTSFFMIGNHGEGLLDFLKTWNFVMKTRLDETGFSIATPFPETEFYNSLKKEGYIQKELDWSKATATIPLVRTDKMSEREIYLFYILISSFFAFKNSKERIQLLKKIPNSLKEVIHALHVEGVGGG